MKPVNSIFEGSSAPRTGAHMDIFSFWDISPRGCTYLFCNESDGI